MINVPFIAIVPGLIVAALTPAKVSDVETNPSTAPALKLPSVIYVKSFNISNTVAASGDTTASGRPHLLGRLRRRGEYSHRPPSGTATGEHAGKSTRSSPKDAH
jgi:hypothetical protein